MWKKHEKRKLIFLNFEEIFLRAEVLFWLDLFLDALLSYAYDAILLVYKQTISAQYMHSFSLFLCNLHSQNNSISTRSFYAAAQTRNNKIAQSNYSLVLKFYYFHFPLLRAWDCRVGKIVFILKKIIFAIFHT